jgi:hypothetical protein
MALNSSGPISLGGATTGQSINLELSQAATATISLNDTNARALAGVTSGQISISNFYGKSSATYFAFYASSPQLRVAATDSSNNFYPSGQNNSNNRGTWFRLSSAGANQQQVTTTTNSVAPSRAVITTDNVFVGLQPGSGTLSGITPSTLARSWSYNLTASGGYTYRLNNIVKGAGGLVYVQGSANLPEPCCNERPFGWIGKYNSSGTVQAGIRFDNGTGQQTAFYALGMDLAGTTGSATTYYYTGSAYVFGVLQFNTSLSVAWHRQLGAGSTWYPWVTAVDSTGSVYVGTGAGVFYTSYVYKFNSSGTYQWSRQIGSNSSSSIDAISIDKGAIDSSDNFYVAGYNGANYPNRVVLIAKYNSSGVLQWQRRLKSNNNANIQNFSIAPNGAMVICVGIGEFTPWPSTVWVLPADGSKTGTYSVGGRTWTYEVSSMPESALANTTSTVSAGVVSLTPGSSNFAWATTSSGDTTTTTIL